MRIFVYRIGNKYMELYESNERDSIWDYLESLRSRSPQVILFEGDINLEAVAQILWIPKLLRIVRNAHDFTIEGNWRYECKQFKKYLRTDYPDLFPMEVITNGIQ